MNNKWLIQSVLYLGRLTMPLINYATNLEYM